MKTKSKTTKTLQILTGVFAALYFIIIAMSFYSESGLSFSNLIDNMNLGLLLVFIAGFALSWTNKKMAGIIFMIWNAGVWISVLYFDRLHDDRTMAGIMATSVMVIGALFILEWYKTSKATVPKEQKQWKFILRILLINYAVLYGIAVLSELLFGKSVD